MVRAYRFALFGLIAIGVAACARSGPPAPVYVGAGGAPAARSQQAAGEAIAPGSTYIVRPGDTLYTIARRSGVPTRAIIDANRLQPPYALDGGTRIAIPAVQTYEVRAGDTVSQIASRFGVPMRELVRANSIEPPYVIRVGQKLVLPETNRAVVAANAPPPAVVAANQPAARIAGPAGPSAPRTAVESGPLPAPAAPQAAAQSAAPHVEPQASAPAASAASATPPQAQPPSAAPAQVASLPVEPANPPATPPSSEAGVRAAEGRMQWPVRGVVVSDFGPKAGGLQNDGINIAAPRGTAFRAADSGVVIYAGNELRGFGNLLLVRHDGGVVTAYAHADELTVQRGDQVRRGQTIGRVGSTGNVTSPQLHFEVRRGNRAVNPMEYLGAQSAAN
jgi:murein DD-endopeptidase MepM/ murein hydrolase activator NlpD